MRPQSFRFHLLTGALALCYLASALAQGPPPGFGPGGPGGRGGGPGGMQQDLKIVKDFDKDGDKRLNNAERKAAREYLATQTQGGPGGFGPGGFGPGQGGPGRGGPGGFGRGGAQQPGTPGPKLSPANVKSYTSESLYDMATLRTFFLEFENADWEKELSDFYHTDVEVPAKLTVDGKTYPDVGVHFRGNTSYMMVSEGSKRSLNLSFDFVNKEQRLGGYRTLNLLNSIGDPTYLRTVLYMQIARDYIPAPKANWARVVINGESWGVYVNVQQFNTDFTKEYFGATTGGRWKVPGNPGATSGGLAYLGEAVSAYKRAYEIKSKDDPKAWTDLIKLCKVLNETPPDKLETALEPLLDVDGALKFLAVDKALINGDGYWTRASDYDIYQDPKGRFHVIPYDANETFSPSEGGGPGGPRGGDGGFPGGGPGMGRGGMGGGGIDLDPLAGATDSNKALLYRLLAVPTLRARYLSYVRDIAERWLVWDKIGPLAQQYQALIAADMKTDTRKLDSTEAFTKGLTEDAAEQGFRGFPGPPGGSSMSLKSFVEKRRAYLLDNADVKAAAKL